MNKYIHVKVEVDKKLIDKIRNYIIKHDTDPRYQDDIGIELLAGDIMMDYNISEEEWRLYVLPELRRNGLFVEV